MARKNSKKTRNSSRAKIGAQSESSALPSPAHGKKLARSSSNRVLLGVMGGIAEYIGADPLHVRLAWWAFIIAAGLAAGSVAYALVPTVLTIIGVAYLIAFLLMNEAPVD